MDLFLLLCQSTRTFNIFIQNIFPVSSYSSICREIETCAHSAEWSKLVNHVCPFGMEGTGEEKD